MRGATLRTNRAKVELARRAPHHRLHVGARPRAACVAALGALAAVVGAGCTTGLPAPPPKEEQPRWTRVEYRAGIEVKPPEYNVRGTATYEAQRALWSVVALKRPDSCRDDTAARATGMARDAEMVVAATRCGFYLAEIERALVEAGYRVISWNALQQAEDQLKVSTYVAARQLGAQVVFLFNSLEASDLDAGSIGGNSIKYYRSDETGAALAPAPLEEASRTYFKAFVQSRLGLAELSKETLAIAATLDATAVRTDTGEAVWFYRKAETDPVKTSVGSRLLFMQSPRDQYARYYLMTPTSVTAALAKAADERLAFEVISSSDGAHPRDPYQAERMRLIHGAVGDFASQFRGPKRAGEASHAPPLPPGAPPVGAAPPPATTAAPSAVPPAPALAAPAPVKPPAAVPWWKKPAVVPSAPAPLPPGGAQ